MTPMQQLFLGQGSKKDPVYMDDVFSTYLWEGNSTENRNINNSINLSGEGGMVWIKKRNGADDNLIYDTVRGHNERLITNSTTDNAGLGQRLTGFNTNGFKLGNNSQVNASSSTYASWSFRKTPGFFDVVTWTTSNDGSAQRISHNLGCVPGLIIIKSLHQTENWTVYHRDTGRSKILNLNTTAAMTNSNNLWGTSDPTSTDFGWGGGVYNGNQAMVAYVFAGGASTNALARSVAFDDAAGDQLTTNSSSDYTPGTSDFTLEYWYKPDENAVDFLVDAAGGGEIWATYCNASGIHKYRTGGTDRIISTSSLKPGQWYHIAVVRISNTVTMYINGIPEGDTYNDTNNYTFNQLNIGIRTDGSYGYTGKISNLRFVVGTGVYTSAFRVPTSPLTSITNTKLLCCNNSSITGATVGTLTSGGSPTASTDSPFDDPAGFVFGDAGDQNVIKCGSYVGNGSSTGPEINLGWEPQWIIAKRTDSAADWDILDSIRGWTTNAGNTDGVLMADLNDQEYEMNRSYLTPTGFGIETTSGGWNASGGTYIYVAIRRPDGYCGKPSLGSDCFQMDTGNNSSTIPAFTSGFPVDFAIFRAPASTTSWLTGARLIGDRYLNIDSSNGEASWAAAVKYDSNEGWIKWAYTTTNQSWMWKRGAGMDVVTYKADGVAGRQIPHSLSKTPEMIWLKQRNSNNTSWAVGHKDLNGGTDPWDYRLKLNSTDAEADVITIFNDTAPTSTHFTVGDSSWVNGTNNYDQIAMLFASISGVSKVGEFDGSSSDVTLTTGFTPRFIIIKSTTHAQNWCVFDTLRSLGSSGNDKLLKLNSSAAESAANTDYVNTTATGFVVKSGQSAETNGGSTYKYIYYAHA